MKKRSKKILTFLLVAMLSFNYYFPFVEIVMANEVPRELAPYYFEGVSEGEVVKLGFNSNTTKEITFHTLSADYVINGINCDNDVVSYTQDDNKITFKSQYYGYTNVRVRVWNFTEYKEETLNFYIDVETDKFVEMSVDALGDTIKGYPYSYLEEKLPVGIRYSTEGFDTPYPGLNCPNEECEIFFAYGYNDFTNGYTTKYTAITSKKFKIEENLLNQAYLYVNNKTYVGNTKAYVNVSNYTGSYDDLMFTSSNPEVATIEQTGKLNLLRAGTTEIRVYNKKDLSYLRLKVEVVENVYNDVQQYVDSLKNSTITIDINEIYYDDTIDLKNILSSYISNDIYKKIKTNEGYDISSDRIECTDNICNIKIKKYNDDSIYEANNIEVLVKGIRFNYVMQPLNVDSVYDFSYTKKLNENDTITFEYDTNYLEKISDTQFKMLREGKTTLTAKSDSGYSSSLKLEIVENSTETIGSYVNSLKLISLPYTENSLKDSYYLNLEKAVETYALNKFPYTKLRNDFKITNISCLTSNTCSIRYEYIGNNTSDFGKVNAKIIYQDSKEYNATLLSDLNEKINSNYILGFDETFKIAAMASDSENMSNLMLEKTDLYKYLNNNHIEYELNKLHTTQEYGVINNYYILNVKENDEIVFTKNITITGSLILNVPSELEENQTIESYMLDHIGNLMNSTPTILHTTRNEYNVTINGKTIGILVDQKEAIEVNYYNVQKRLYNLSVNGTEKIQYNVYPVYANKGNIEFKSLNEQIATVNENGIITAKKKGYTWIQFNNKNMSTKLLVLVDTSMTEFLNDEFNYDGSTIELDYSDYDHSGIEQSIQNYFNWTKNSYEYNINYEAQKIEDKIFVRSYFSDYSTYPTKIYYSDFKEVKYTLKGIKVEKNKYHVAVGDKIDLNVYFSEGDKYNLYYSSDDNFIATVDKKGIVTAKKPGKIYINISDKYNKYYNYVEVYIDYDNYLEQIVAELKERPIEVTVTKGAVFTTAVYDYLNQKYGPVYQGVDCNESTYKCTIDFKNYDDSTKEETIQFAPKGISPRFYNTPSINIGEEFTVESNVYGDSRNVTIEVNKPLVCRVEGDKIIGVSTGICEVKVSNDDGYYGFALAVNADDMVDEMQEKLNQLDDTIYLKAINAQNLLNDATEESKWQIMEGYYLMIQKYIESQLNLNNSHEIETYSTEPRFEINTSDLEEGLQNQNIGVSISVNYNNFANDMYYYGSFGTTDTKAFNIVYEGVSDATKEAEKKINNKVKDKYELDLTQLLKYKIDQSQTSDYLRLRDYTTYEEDLASVCPDCEIIEMGGYGNGPSGYIVEGNLFIFILNGELVTSKEITFEARFDVEQTSSIATEEELIETIKNQLTEAYLKAKNDTSSLLANDNAGYEMLLLNRNIENKSSRVMFLNNVVPLANEVNVQVSKKFNTTIGKYVYTFKIEDIEIETALSFSYDGELDYTYSVVGIETDKTNITMHVGDSTKVNVTIKPDNATNKNVTIESSDTNVAKIVDGRIVAVGHGTATITYTTLDGNYKAEVLVTVEKTPTNDDTTIESTKPNTSTTTTKKNNNKNNSTNTTNTITNNNLEKLEIKGYIIDFKEDKYEYNITLTEDNLEIIAVAKDSNAKVEILKPDVFVEGDNIIKVIVSSNNEATEYIIHANKKAETAKKEQEANSISEVDKEEKEEFKLNKWLISLIGIGIIGIIFIIGIKKMK